MAWKNRLRTVLILLNIIALKANELLPRAAVINLPRSTSRRSHMAKELSSKNVSFFWINAVDGKDLTKAELQNEVTALARWFMTPGMIGCFLSHRICWQYCLESSKPLIVFEDDVILADDFNNILSQTMKEMNQENIEWDILLLGAMGCVHPKNTKYGLNWILALVGGKWRKTRPIAKVQVDMKTDNDIQSKSFLLHVPMFPLGGHAYIISPKGAAKLLKECRRASYHVDAVAWGLKILNVIAIHPLIAWQTNQDTTIGGTVQNWKFFTASSWVMDKYTGQGIGQAIGEPLLRLGGPLLGGKVILTTGNSLALMFIGFLASIITQSQQLFYITLSYIFVVAGTVRLLSSKWNT